MYMYIRSYYIHTSKLTDFMYSVSTRYELVKLYTQLSGYPFFIANKGKIANSNGETLA